MTTPPRLVRHFAVDRLDVQVYATRDDMGLRAALDAAEAIAQLLATHDRVRIVFAAAPSQNEFLAQLGSLPNLDWARVEAFHMDEYLGLPDAAPQSFGAFLREHLFNRVSPGRVEYLDGSAVDAGAECLRYAALLAERPVDIVCAGIGENGHMAFNDPPVADFYDPQAVKIVTLDEVCRMQQVHDGAFDTLDDVPRTAITLTIPTLMSARRVLCIVPGSTKAAAVHATLRGAIASSCPATIMRRHAAATLYLDTAAAARL